MASEDMAQDVAPLALIGQRRSGSAQLDREEGSEADQLPGQAEPVLQDRRQPRPDGATKQQGGAA